MVFIVDDSVTAMYPGEDDAGGLKMARIMAIFRPENGPEMDDVFSPKEKTWWG